ncbi:MAG: bleomycin resistance family protein [Bacteroidia bacterium]
MNLLSLTPTIWTSQLNETIKFYSENLKFVCKVKNEEWGWASVCFGEVEIMISVPNKHTDFIKPLFTGTFYFRTDNVDELWYELKDKVKVGYDLEEFEYGMREFAIFDNNGYMLQFGQEIK